MAEAKKSKESGAAKATKTWTPEVKPNEGDDLTVESPNVVKWNSLLSTMRSVVVKPGATLEVTLELLVGAATAGPENVALKHEGTATGEAEIVFNGSFATTAQTITAPTLKPTVKFTGTGKWKLLSALKTSSQIKQSAGTLEGNGQAIEGSAVEVTGGTLDISACTVKTTGGVGTGWSCAAAATLTTTSGTVIEVPGKFGGGGHTYLGTVRVTGRKCLFDTGSQTINTLELLNKGTGEGAQFLAGELTTFTTFTTNGTLAERARAESKTAASPWKLKGPGDYEPANSFLAVKDCTYEGGILYLPHGEDLGGNTNIAFEAKPGEGAVFGKASGALTLTGTATGVARNVVTGKATGPLLLGGTASATVRAVVSGKASGTLLLGGAAKGSAAGTVFGKAAGTLLLGGTATGTVRSVVTASATGPLLLTGTSKATVRAVITGKATGALLLGGTAKANVAGAVSGKASGALTLAGTAKATLRAVVTGKATGTLVLTGTATGHTAQLVTGHATGTILLAGTSKGTLHANVVGHATGALLLTGSAHATGQVAAPARIRFTNQKATTIRVLNQKQTRVTVENRKQTAGSYQRT